MLDDAQEKALKEAHKLELDAQKATATAEAATLKSNVETLTGEVNTLKAASTGGDTYWKKEFEKARDKRDAKTKELEDALAKLESQPDTLKAELEADWAKQKADLELSHAIKTLLNTASVDPKMEAYAVQAIGAYELTQDDSGSLVGKIEGEVKPAAEVVEHLRESTPNFFEAANNRSNFQAAPAGQPGKMSIRDEQGRLSTSMIEERAMRSILNK